jgi:hypothetical protein
MVRNTEQQTNKMAPQWRDDEVPKNYDYGKPFVTCKEYIALPWETKRWHN